MIMSYCQICGDKLVAKKDHSECPSCKQRHYANPKPCVEIALFNETGQLLLAKRAREPYKGKYDLPGGFIDLGETAEEAIGREIKEELSLEWGQIKDVNYATSYTGEYPWGSDTYETLILVFVGRTVVTELSPQDDVEEVVWTNPSDISAEMLSTPLLKQIIDKLVEYNRSRGE